MKSVPTNPSLPYAGIDLVKTHHITYKKHEELHKARVRQMREHGEYPELHHVSTRQSHADCHQNQYATHRPNNIYAKTLHPTSMTFHSTS